MTATGAVPFVIGQWVRGGKFYGRERELAALLHPDARASWVAGLRRIGKTSLLRQLELALGRVDRPKLPLFWDLQGVEDLSELTFSFSEALFEVEATLVEWALPVAELEEASPVDALAQVVDEALRRGVEPVLLCDEADALLKLDGAARAEIARALRVPLDEARGGVVIASSVRLEMEAKNELELAELLAPFASPLYLGAMPDVEAEALVTQSQLPTEARPGFDRTTVEAIRRTVGGHPMLLQLLAKRCHERGNLEAALAEVAADRAVGHLFAVDLDLLEASERAALAEVARSRKGAAEGVRALEHPALERLVRLGLVEVGGEGEPLITNRLLADWLA